MKITFSREEVEDIILAHVARLVAPSAFNRVELSSLYSRDFATVTYEAPEPAVVVDHDLKVAA